MTRDELLAILERHTRWLRHAEGGARADLGGADLGDANLRGANLGCADLGDANLRVEVPIIPQLHRRILEPALADIKACAAKETEVANA